MPTKLAKDLQRGDRVVTEDGTERTVQRVTLGFIRVGGRDTPRRRSVIIEFSDGQWSQIRHDATLAVANRPLPQF